ncbi:type IV secretion system DNA-binding domain-containing protein [Rubrimonas cliftonensis]|uniref:Type IV secretion-system coupling protein DNA-binding domain-containing protein n=1 Tax=Rubrimonas cliftonensis TaxID=89524 RepID=A0A1H4ESC6_9RHOB|nr:type IV secretion system DNA-binding domain-containing protein [Rubrimonas cliftonensis]SEA87965.1 Type IV secretion-system coupling protein DNA-binding domain-containing protein [Rubrimonas cliftonensis]
MTPIRHRPLMGDSFARGFDIFRLQATLQARSIALMLKILGAIGMLGVGVWVWLTVPDFVLLGAARYVGAYVVTGLVGVDLDAIPVLTDSGWQSWPSARILRDPWHVGAWNLAVEATLHAVAVFLLLSGPLAYALYLLAKRRGHTATADLLARGQRVVEARELGRLVRRGAAVSKFTIGAVPMPEAVLNRAFVALGTPGTGKSVLIKRWLREVRARGDMAIVFDKVGDFTAEFFDARRGDVLLNPLDARSPPWSPWAEMRSIADAYRIARALIPSTQGDNNFFHTAAQDLFATLLTRIWRMRNRSLMALLEAALIWDRESKATLLEGTSAAKHYQGDHRSGHDVDATMSVYTQALRFLSTRSGGPDDFSVRDFITDAVTAMETRPDAARAALAARFDAEYAELLQARNLLAVGDLARAARLVQRVSLVFPLLPDGMAAPAEGAGFTVWWDANRAEIEAHWRAQDAARDDVLAGREARRREAAARLRARGAPWLFIASDQRQLAAVRPVLSLWLDAVADTILSLPPNPQRRIWLMLDELQALQELPSLQPLLTEGRKYGACVVAGVQNMGQLRQNYGPDRAEVLMSLFNTKTFFRLPEPRTAKWCEDAIGSAVVERIGESIRYGTSETMDGAQLSPHRSTEPIVMAGDIARQPDLHCYLTLPGNWPVGRIQLAFDKRRDAPPPIAAALTPRPPEQTIFHALDRKGWQPIPEGDDPLGAGDIARTLKGSTLPDPAPAEKTSPAMRAKDAAGAAPAAKSAQPARPSRAADTTPNAAGKPDPATATTPEAPRAAAPVSDAAPMDRPTASSHPGMARPPVGDLGRRATPSAPRPQTPPNAATAETPDLFGDGAAAPSSRRPDSKL